MDKLKNNNNKAKIEKIVIEKKKLIKNLKNYVIKILFLMIYPIKFPLKILFISIL